MFQKGSTMMNRRRSWFHKGGILAGIAISGTMVLTGCGSDPGAEKATETGLTDLLPQDVRDAGMLEVASVIGKPPGTFKDDSGEVVGMHIEFMEAVGKALGIDIKWSYTSFDGVIPGIQAKRHDAAIAQIGDFASREKVVTFVNYQKSGFSFLTQAENDADYEDAEALCGLTVATSKGSAQTDIINDASKDCTSRGEDAIEISTFPGFDEQLLALSSGRVDVIAGDSDAVLYISDSQSDKFRQTGPTNFVALTGIPIDKGREDLAKALQAGVQKLMDDGSYNEILTKWGQQSTAIDTAEINGGSKFGWGPKL